MPFTKSLFIAALSVIIFGLLTFGFFYWSLGEFRAFGFLRVTNFPDSQKYLIVLQNDAERRPTGGFLTSYGILTFRFGIPSFQLGNVYDPRLIQQDTVAPDPTVAQLLASPFFPGHGFRDSNFDPNFPTAAEEMLHTFALGFPETQLAGVFALDFTAVARLAQTLNLPEINFLDLSARVKTIDLHNPAEIFKRKDFLAELTQKLCWYAFTKPQQTVASLLTSFREKNALLYFRDPELQALARQQNFAGELSGPPNSDFLAIVEGNYGGLKSSRYLLKNFTYTLDFREDLKQPNANTFTIWATLEIELTHAGQNAELISGFYQSFWRAYLPPGIQLLEQTSAREFETGKAKVLEKIVQMQPGESRRLKFRYQLPASVLQEGQYRLKVWRQPGGDPFLGRIVARLPAGYRTHSAQFRAREELALFEGNFAQDTSLVLTILPDKMPPRLAWQDFVGGLKEIDLRFNEPLAAASIQAENFQLRDLNFRNSTSDPVAITAVRFLPPQNIRLTVQGIQPVCREHFGLTLQGLTDQHGNTLPSQEVTVVTWLTETGAICDPALALN